MLNDVSPQILLAFFEDAWLRAKDQANTFRDQLAGDLSATLSLIRQGSIASVGKNSANQTYKGYGPGALTQVQITEILSDLIAIYDQLKDNITNLFTCNPTDWPAGVPADFDFDLPIYNFVRRALGSMAAGTATLLTDISRLRLPPSVLLNPTPATW